MPSSLRSCPLPFAIRGVCERNDPAVNAVVAGLDRKVTPTHGDDRRGHFIVRGAAKFHRIGLDQDIQFRTALFDETVHQTRDRFRVVLPYIELNNIGRPTGGLLLDSSVFVDGRFVDLCETQIVSGPLLVPQFVVGELQTLADSEEKIKRDRGRRGLDLLSRLQDNNP